MMFALMLKEFTANWRSFRYPSLIIISLFFAILDPLMLKYMNEILGYFATGIEITVPDPTPADAFLSFLTDLSQIGTFVLIFIVMGTVAREKENGVSGWLISKPIGRWRYLLAKYYVLISFVIICYSFSSLIAYLYTSSLLGTIPPLRAVAASAALIAFTILFATITFAYSTVTNSALQAGALSVLTFFISGILNIFISGSGAEDYYPNSLLARMLPLLEGSLKGNDIVLPLMVSLLFSLLLLLLTGKIFSRTEL